MTDCVVADLGGTFLRCGLVGDLDSIAALERLRLPGDARTRTPEVWTEIVEAIAAYVDRHSADISASAPIAFAFPGPLCDGRVTAAPTVLGGDWATPDIRVRLADRTRRDVVIVNDVSAAAWYFSDRIPIDRFVVVTVSSGIGAKIFDRRHALGVLDDVSCAGEIGHLVVDEGPAAPVCDCGGRGHLGAIASARGFERSARLAAEHDAGAFARSANVLRYGAAPATLCNETHLVPALQAGDPWSLELLRASIRPLSNVLRSLCVGCGLHGIVLMGGFAQALGETYRALVEDAVGLLSDRGPALTPLRGGVVLARVGEEPSLLGAATYARMARLVS